MANIKKAALAFAACGRRTPHQNKFGAGHVAMSYREAQATCPAVSAQRSPFRERAAIVPRAKLVRGWKSYNRMNHMLGKGLESLLPKKSSAVPPSMPRIAPGSLGRGPTGEPVLSYRPPSLPPREEAERPRESLQKKAPHEAIFQIEVEKITPNPYQPRRTFKEAELEELAASIREFGVLQPLVVSKRVEETGEGAVVEYELIAGERRLLAAKRAGLPRVPAIVKRMDSRHAKLEIALVENLQRSGLSSLETARAYARLQEEFGLTQREIGVRVGKSREAVANTLRLLSLPSDALQALSEGKINESQARTLLSVEDFSARATLFQEFLTGRATVRAFREKAATVPALPEDIAAVRALEEKLGTPVRVTRRGRGGAITITFYSDEEYRSVRARLLGGDW